MCSIDGIAPTLDDHSSGKASAVFGLFAKDPGCMQEYLRPPFVKSKCYLMILSSAGSFSFNCEILDVSETEESLLKLFLT